MSQNRKFSVVTLLITIITILALMPFLSVQSMVHAQDEPTPTETPTETPTPEALPTAVPTDIPLDTATPEPTATLEPTLEIVLPSETPTETLTETPTETPTLEPTPLPVFGWNLVFKLSDEQLAAVGSSEYGIFDKLTAHGVSYEIVDNKLKLAGNQSLDQLRTAAYEDISPVVDFLGGKIEVTILMSSYSGAAVDVSLESRFGTGSMWYVTAVDGVTYVKMGEDTVEQRYPGPSSPSTQKLHLQSSTDGAGVLALSYGRSWEDTTVRARLVIQLTDSPASIDLTDPAPYIIDMAQSQAQPEDISALEDLPTGQTLPASLDWRGDIERPNVVPAVRDQTSYCGSCWAFGTVGVIESALKKAGGPMTDLSEQFLISCNKSGWNCSGGLTAHAYHYNALGYNQTAYGAVLEADKSYTATNGTCTVAYNHPYKLSGWQFVTGSEWTMPTVDQIKTAIYNYGPITAGVCVGPNFEAYTSGVMTVGDDAVKYCGGYTNHQIILVGWNDATNSWILRNSWGSGWGESGYMRIGYGISRVGEGTSWVTVNSAAFGAGTPTLTSPANGYTTGNGVNTFQWTSVTNGASYDIHIDDVNTFPSPFVATGGSGFQSYTSGDLAGGTWYWRVRAYNSSGTPGSWSATRYLVVDKTPPAPPVLSLPANLATVRTGTVAFSWLASATATNYEFQYDDVNTFVSPNYTSGVLTTLNHTPPAMSYGDFYWQVRAADAYNNWSSWSGYRTLYVRPPLPAAVVLNSPANAYLTNSGGINFQWYLTPNGNAYDIHIDDQSTFADPNYIATCGSACTNWTPSDLPHGTWYWRVRAYNTYSEPGPWSAVRYVVVDKIPPAAPILSLPADNAPNIRGTPTFSWLAAATANLYQFQYDDDTGFVAPTYTSDGIAILSHKPTPDMALGTWYWRVRARDAATNWGPWSTYRTLTIHPPLPLAPVLTSPANAFQSNDTTPTFTWNAVSYAVSYEIQIDNLATFADPVEMLRNVTELTYTADTPLIEGLKYWRVRGFNADIEPGAWSLVRTINIDLTPPLAPVLSLPAEGAIVRATPAFSWLAAAGANAYEFSYKWMGESWNYYTSPVLSTVTYTPPNMNIGLRFWKVRARDAAGNWGPWTAERTLDIRQPIPAAPVLSSPANGFATNDTTPDFDWTAVTNATYYEIQIDNLATFAVPLEYYEYTPNTNHTVAVTPLTEGLKYWRVRAYNIHDEAGPWSLVRTINIDLTPPLAPVLSLPANAAIVRGTPTFSWLAAAGANAYEFHYDQADNFPDPDYTSPVLAVLTHKPPEMAIAVHYWQVRARDPAGNWGPWSTPRSVDIRQPIPLAPVLTSPLNGALSKNDPLLNFTWGAVTYGNMYQIQIDNLATFTAPVDIDTMSPSPFYALSGPITPDGVRYWRVRAYNIHNEPGAWSLVRAFTIDTTPPAAPLLYLPLDNAPGIRATPIFYWYAAIGANAYEFQYDDDVAFGSPYTSPVLAVLSHKPTPDMALLTPFYWHVRARDAAGNWGPYSTYRTISILPPIPAAPVLTSPATGFITNDTTPDFDWNAAASASYYEIQIDNLATFAVPLEYYEYTPNTNHTVAVTPLTEGLKYWRVRAYNIHDEAGPWSLVRTINIDLTPPLAPVLSLPANAAIVRGTPTFSWLAAAGANAYEFHYDQADNFPDPDYTSPVLAVLTHKPPEMAIAVHYWQVRARDPAGNWGPYSTYRTISILPPIPAAPVLTSPATGFITNDTTPDFTWNAVAGAVGYEIQIDNLATFAAPVDQTASGLGLTYTATSLTDGLKYWRVRAKNAADEFGAWSLARTFTIDTLAPLPPVHSLPAVNATVRTTPAFSWLASAGASKYVFCYDDTANMSSPLYCSAELAVLTITPPAMSTGDFYWGVKAKDAAGNLSALPNPGRLLYVRPALLAAPVLVSPANAAVTLDTTPDFSWAAVAGASSYELQIDDIATFASPYYQTTVAGTSHNSANMSYGVWYWRVRSLNSYSESGPWSAARYFVENSFSNNFNGSAPNWYSYPAGYWTVGPNYLVSNGMVGKWTNAYHGSTQSNFVYEARVYKAEDYVNNPSSWYSFGLHVRSGSTFNSMNNFNTDYKFLIHNGGKYSIWKTVGGVVYQIAPWTTTSAIVQEGWNTLKLVASGSTISFYINGTLVYSGTVFTVASGKVGVLHYLGVSATEPMSVDYATLGPLPASAMEVLEIPVEVNSQTYPGYDSTGMPK